MSARCSRPTSPRCWANSGSRESPVRSVSYPFLRHVVSLGEAWEAFIARGADEPRELVEAGAAAVVPE